MKRLSILIDDELDEALVRAAAEARTSKSELVRRIVRQRVILPPLEDDPLMQMAGADDFVPVPVDEVVYG